VDQSAPEHLRQSRAHIDIQWSTVIRHRSSPSAAPLRPCKGGDIDWTVVTTGWCRCLRVRTAPAAPTALGPFELVVDAVDPPSIAGWWAERTGGTVGTREGAPYVWIQNAAGFPYMFWVFHEVPEPKTVKNRVHWDVTLLDAGVDELVAVGATLLNPKGTENRWSVMADPEGNEFCAFDNED
jgi:hypothetical protein